jgi:transcriptional regulator of acetoin/glycerol metabolism
MRTTMGETQQKGPGGFHVTQWTMLVHLDPQQARREIQLALDRAGGNITEAAKAAGCSRQSLHTYLKKLGMRGDR